LPDIDEAVPSDLHHFAVAALCHLGSDALFLGARDQVVDQDAEPATGFGAKLGNDAD